MKGYYSGGILYHILKQIHDKDILSAYWFKKNLSIHAKLSHVCVTPYIL